MADDAIAALRGARYVLLTTFKKDGTAVATPVWAAEDGDRLLVWTGKETGKAKRLRRSSRVMVAPCNFRGTPKGDTVETRATLLDAEGTVRTRDAIRTKYGWQGRLFVRIETRRSGIEGMQGIAVELPR